MERERLGHDDSGERGLEGLGHDPQLTFLSNKRTVVLGFCKKATMVSTTDVTHANDVHEAR